MNSSPRRIVRAKAVLAVIDIQERLLPAMHEKERVVQNAVRLVQAAGILKLPVIVTEQYRKGMGATIPEVAAEVPDFRPIEKLSFSCCGADEFGATLEKTGGTDVILCGIEAHVCVLQTALDLLDRGFRAFVVADAVSSRSPANLTVALERLRESGAGIVSTEMILFELLDRAGTGEFKQILPLVK